jgi:F-type H+-transporting ATPase subunit d
MAAKRFTKSTIDWAALFERVPANQKNNLIAFRGRSETYMRK